MKRSVCGLILSYNLALPRRSYKNIKNLRIISLWAIVGPEFVENEAGMLTATFSKMER
jgi:hypothetical protein